MWVLGPLSHSSASRLFSQSGSFTLRVLWPEKAPSVPVVGLKGKLPWDFSEPRNKSYLARPNNFWSFIFPHRKNTLDKVHTKRHFSKTYQEYLQVLLYSFEKLYQAAKKSIFINVSLA